MKPISAYVPAESPIHDADPLTKLLGAAVIILCPLMLNTLASYAAFLALTLALLGISKTLFRALKVLWFVSILVASLFIVQGLFGVANSEPLFRLGGLVFYREGVYSAAVISLRLFVIIMSCMTVFLTTKPDDLTEELIGVGMPVKVGFLLMSLFLIIPRMLQSAGTISDAQRARGMETGGSLFRRARAFVPLIGPVALQALLNSRERSMALEVRCFDVRGKKTRLRERYVYKYAVPVRVALAALFSASLAGRMFL